MRTLRRRKFRVFPRAPKGATTQPPVQPQPTGIAAFYGTAMGQVPFHLSADGATVDGSGNVISVANAGGAGAALNAAAGGGAIAKSGDTLAFPTASAWLDLASPLNLDGARLFLAASIPGTSWRTIGSAEAGTAGNRLDDTYIEFARTYTARKIRFNKGGNWTESGTSFATGSAMAVYEVEKAGGRLKVWVNGAQISDNAEVALITGAFAITRLFAGQVSSGDDWVGPVGAVLTRLTDGSAGMDAGNATIRQELATRYGVTLA